MTFEIGRPILRRGNHAIDWLPTATKSSRRTPTRNSTFSSDGLNGNGFCLLNRPIKDHIFIFLPVEDTAANKNNKRLKPSGLYSSVGLGALFHGSWFHLVSFERLKITRNVQYLPTGAATFWQLSPNNLLAITGFCRRYFQSPTWNDLSLKDPLQSFQWSSSSTFSTSTLHTRWTTENKSLFTNIFPWLTCR